MKNRITYLLIIYLIFFRLAFGKDEFADLPIYNQIIITLTALKYDMNFMDHLKSKEKIEIGLFHAATDESLQYKREFYRVYDEEFKTKIFYGLPLQLEAVSSLQLLKSKKYDLMFIAPGTDRVIENILKITAANGITSVTGVSRYLNSGITLIVGLKNKKSFLGVNLQNSKKENCRFQAKLLQLATIIGE